ncbi:probable beta-galactosidase [Phialocephala subalpina]|uniref:beta-galactosidase n=1 Tax=Phialocephala subalpina TaxID=576137 RepID=A0A1L7XWE3_9HELO|nr:probable beta-galactosidase [Phialocephala subalpina]
MKFLCILFFVAFPAQASTLSIRSKAPHTIRDSDGLQNIVTWDEHSLFVHGERVFLFSGEFHPFRLPVAGLYIDVFQKIKALGFNAVSFYTFWPLLEGEPGVYRADGIFDLQPFFDAATYAGIWLIARPGPYINSEATGGGLPGWLQRITGQLRTTDPSYLNATNNYMAHMGATIAKAQITNGGPIILTKVGNEYSIDPAMIASLTGLPQSNLPNPNISVDGGFPDLAYMGYVKQQLRNAGVVVPLTFNDAVALGHFAPGFAVNGSTAGDVNIYSHDSYPLDYTCDNAGIWSYDSVLSTLYEVHEEQSPTTPYMISEFEGSAGDGWGGFGFNVCAQKLNQEFERVYYKNNFANGIKIINIYMVYGGTNWGNIGYPGGYTSYDEGAAINESREITREKWSELKLEANFMKVTPAYLTATPGVGVNGTYTNNDAIYTTPLYGNGSATNFYIVRSADPNSTDTKTYTLRLPTSKGIVSIPQGPQLGGTLTLSARDSKWHVTDYDIGGTTLLYSTAEIFTWKIVGNYTNLVVYGGPGELHELSIITESEAVIVEGSDITTKSINGTVGTLYVYVLDRNRADNYWTPDCLNSSATSSLILEAGYLVRSACVQESAVHIVGDLNATVPLKVIGAPAGTNALYFNEQLIDFTTCSTGELSSTLQYSSSSITLPDLSILGWKYLDDLPELQSSYDDSTWTPADHNTTINPTLLQTPTSLYSSDYGYHAGVLVYRGHFVANGTEKSLYISTQGGASFSSSVWLNSTFLGSWVGIANVEYDNSTYDMPSLTAGEPYVFTVVVDNNGLDYDVLVGSDFMKKPRGILDYDLPGHPKSDVTWKLTGNLGGEEYIDKVRGPLNEGGLFAERQGYTQPSPPSQNWTAGSPTEGLSEAGVAFYSTSLQLDLPSGYDIPLNFEFGNATAGGAVQNYTALLWVNGYQFGKYKNMLGPQTSFPVPQGVLNYQGTNWLGVELWAHDAAGASLLGFQLTAGTPVLTSLTAPASIPQPAWVQRAGSY